jgi:hypothetical protein
MIATIRSALPTNATRRCPDGSRLTGFQPAFRNLHSEHKFRYL